MHICHCFKDFSLNEGGVERHISYLSKEPLQLGNKVSVLVSRRRGSTTKDFINGIEEIRTKPLLKLFKVPIMPGYYNNLVKINPDIVHVHGTIPNVSDVAVFYGLMNKKPSLLHYHFDGNAESALGTCCANLYNSTINSMIVEKVNKVITETKAYAETSPVLRKYLHKIEIVPNGVDLKLFSPDGDTGNIAEEYNLPTGNIILFVGRLVKYKGLEYLIRAMKLVKDGTLLIIGSGQEETHLKTLVKEQQIHNVKFIAGIEHNHLAPFYRISDVFVIPSITRGENFGIAALEAMACGTPVIASDLPGHREFIPDDCGISIKPKDTGELASAINTLLSNRGLQHSMGIAARKNAEKYSWEIASTRIMQIYTDLVNRN